MREAVAPMIMLVSALLHSLTAGEPAASRAADSRRTIDRIRRRKRFADCCRDNRLAHQQRCDETDTLR
ncbi:hypothetical protein A5761_19460 [Mycolicibacterium setense]|nr:hypothetical protein A5761_19460 [Mycolicibacterium setense]